MNSLEEKQKLAIPKMLHTIYRLRPKSITLKKYTNSEQLIFFLKVLVFFNLVIFLIEPLFFNFIIVGKDYSFFNKYQPLYYTSLIIATTLSGVLYGRFKKVSITLIEVTFVITPFLALLYSQTKYQLYPTSAPFIFKYISVLFLFPFISNLTHWLKPQFKEYEQNRKQENQFKLNTDYSLDEFEPDPKQGMKLYDILGYHSLAMDIFKALNAIELKKAFAIGINGSWGSGKSSLLGILKKDFFDKQDLSNKNQRSFKVFSFSPWLYPDELSMLASFFRKWREEIDDISIKYAFDNYLELLSSVELGGIGFDLSKFFTKNNTLESVKKAIEEYLRLKSPFIYVVIIDDLDRLEGQEVLEIARLCRVLADFPNTAYILSYDRKYIDKVLSTIVVADKLHNYFDKIVQLEFKIPQITEYNLGRLVDDIILRNKDFIKTSDPLMSEQEILKVLSKIKALEVYQYYIPTLRDVKRFLNNFLLRYSSLKTQKQDISFREVFLLDLLFYKYKGQYESLYYDRKNTNSGSSLANLINGTFTPVEIGDVTMGIFSERPTSLSSVRMIDAYYSYFSSNTFNEFDVTNYLSNVNGRESILIDLANRGHIFRLLNEIINKISTGITSETMAIDFLSKDLKLIFEQAANFFLKNDVALTKEQLYYLSDNICSKWYLLGENERGLINEKIIESQNIRETLRTFPIPHESWTNFSEQILFKNRSDTNYKLIKNTDDTIFEKVICLDNGPINIEMKSFQAAYWRLGFVLSKTHFLPASFPFRVVRNYPLFHLYKDKGSDIKAIYYNEHEKTVTDNQQLNEVMIQSGSNISVIVRTFADSIEIAIRSDTGFNTTISNLNLKKYKYMRLQAWCDGENPDDYEFPIMLSRSDSANTFQNLTND